MRLEPTVLDAYPHELSGGMRQRVTIALASVCRPDFIIADEPTTALDVVVQKDVLGMLRDVQREIRSSMILVTHDIGVHANVTDRLGIMYAGRLAEEGRTVDVIRNPRHPYTSHLVTSLPRIGDVTQKRGLEGAPPNLANPPPGCRFHPRCPLAIDDLPHRASTDGRCRSRPPRGVLGDSAAHHADRFAMSAAGPPQGTRPLGETARSDARGDPANTPLLDIDRVGMTYVGGGLLRRAAVRAVDDVSLRLEAGKPEIFAVIGESGSGKTTLARMILNLATPTDGTIRFLGADVTRIRTNRDRMAFMRQVQPIFQNPFEAFNPLKRIDRYLFVSARRFAGARGRIDIEAKADKALHQVGLSLAEVKGRFPHELSGGQLQRIAIARALISAPSLIVADEPVSMVDASLRMSIVNLFKALRDELKVSIVYITHDLATAYYISDRVLIMQRGKAVESGNARAVLDNPQHPYSILLKNAVLSPDDAGKPMAPVDAAQDSSGIPVSNEE